MDFDNYDPSYCENVPATYHCGCGNVWEVYGYNELGGWFPYDEDDVYCDECGEEGEFHG